MYVSCSIKSNSLSPRGLLWPLWTHQALVSMGFPRPEYWRGQPFLSPGDLPDPGIEPRFSASQAYSLKSEPPGEPRHSGVASFPLPSCPFPDGEGLEWVILWSRAGGWGEVDHKGLGF